MGCLWSDIWWWRSGSQWYNTLSAFNMHGAVIKMCTTTGAWRWYRCIARFFFFFAAGVPKKRSESRALVAALLMSGLATSDCVAIWLSRS